MNFGKALLSILLVVNLTCHGNFYIKTTSKSGHFPLTLDKEEHTEYLLSCVRECHINPNCQVVKFENNVCQLRASDRIGTTGQTIYKEAPTAGMYLFGNASCNPDCRQLDVITGLTGTECADTCSQNPQCGAAVYVRSTRVCSLKHAWSQDQIWQTTSEDDRNLYVKDLD